MWKGLKMTRNKLLGIIGIIGWLACALLAVQVVNGHENREFKHANENREFKHAKENFVDIIKSNPNDPRCPMGYVWTDSKGKEMCVIFTDHAVHVKILIEGDD
jgi:hypothetical protein